LRARASDEMAVVRPPLDVEPVEPAEPAAPPSVHDAVTVPVAAAPVDPAALVPSAPIVGTPPAKAEPARSKPPTAPPPMDELDTGWDLGDEDPTATAGDKPEPAVSTPSSSEMAGDGAVEGDGIDTGWD
ncbi:MAG TPA: hypothetical protein VFP84_22145, partial [Kofleriaceae bacterium]|nr:hypothetical protein [Kofleriaceae bacterium]